MQTLTVEIMTADALGESEWALWRDMIAANPELTSPYFRPRFTRVAARVCPSAAVAVLHRGGEIVGFFPFQRRGGSILPLGAPMNDFHGVIARPGDAPDLHELARLLNGARMNVGAWVGEAKGMVERDCLMVALPEAGYDAWYAERRETERKYFKDKERARRGLERDLGPIETRTDQRDTALLDHLIELKRDQYRRTGRHDIFACGWTRDLLHALMDEQDGDFGASVATLTAGDTLAAMEFSLHAGNRWHFWFPVYEPAAARCSPGIMLSMDTMRLMGARGYRVFDYGFGGEGYKKYFCNASQTVREGVIVRPGLGATVSQAAVGVLNAAGGDRGERLRNSVRRRWSAIEACETRPGARARGVIQAARAALAKAGPARAEA
ncbi:GNAT family N-acetyltransferase [Brevundimonas sp.]|uniref:GNAT family N-acetyltransferase n=1 Tax=Brevundimonas sp. TaxID=1871086 RepID=UPI00391D5BA2